MGLFNKKDDVPELPTAPGLPELPKAQMQGGELPKKELPELPSFPNNSKNEGFNQEMVKSAINDTKDSGEKEGETAAIPELPKKETPATADISPKPFGSSEGEEDSKPTFPNIPSPVAASKPSVTEEKDDLMPEPVLPSTPSITTSSGQKTGDPIFVRIDKFQASQKNFDEIKSKVNQIENVLKKIKDVKAKEDDELKGWAEDVEKIKLKLGEIDSNIFSQL